MIKLISEPCSLYSSVFDIFFAGKVFFNTKLLQEILEIVATEYHQDIRLKELFPIKRKNAKRTYNKEKYQKHINYLLKLGLIVYDERFLNCNAIETYPKTYRLKFEKSSNTASFSLIHYILLIPKSIHLKFFSMKHEPTINKYKTIFLKYLNQKISFHIYDDTFYYYIEAFINLPNYSKNVNYWIKKQIDWFFLKLLRDGKLVKKRHSDKILQNIEKNIKNRSYKHYFLKGYTSVLILLNKSERVKYLLELRDLDFRETELPFFHNVRIKINGKMVIFRRDINNYLGDGYNGIREVFNRFFEIGLEINGIAKRDITTLELVSFEVSRELNGFNKSKHRDIPVSRYGKDRVRHLIDIGFQNYYCYVDYSGRDNLRNKIPEFEIKYINRNQKTFPEIMRELDFLLDFKPKIDNGIIEIEPFDITASKPEITRFKNDFLLEYEILKEINDLAIKKKSFVLSSNWIFSRLT